MDRLTKSVPVDWRILSLTFFGFLSCGSSATISAICNWMMNVQREYVKWRVPRRWRAKQEREEKEARGGRGELGKGEWGASEKTTEGGRKRRRGGGSYLLFVVLLAGHVAQDVGVRFGGDDGKSSVSHDRKLHKCVGNWILITEIGIHNAISRNIEK